MAHDVPGFQAGPRIWLQLLEHEWDFAREGPRLAGLGRPSFELSPRMTRSLGRWDAGTRTITLSERLLDGRRWHLLVSTLRHEMAHQVVSELWGAPEEPPHGPVFRRACELLGVSAEARATAAELEEEREEPRVVRTIRRLLALSSSPNRHEAEAALAKAQELALKHNVALADDASGQRRQYAHRLLDRPRKRWPSYTWTVLHTCEKLHQVQHIRWTLPDGEAVVELFGAPDNLDLAEYVYHYLLAAGDGEWRRFRQEQGLANNRKRLSFLLALFSAFDRKLARQRQELVTTQALVVSEDAELQAFFRRRYPHVRTGSLSNHQVHADARAAGAEAGGRLQIRPGVGGEGGGRKKPRGLLPGRRG